MWKQSIKHKLPKSKGLQFLKPSSYHLVLFILRNSLKCLVQKFFIHRLGKQAHNNSEYDGYRNSYYHYIHRIPRHCVDKHWLAEQELADSKTCCSFLVYEYKQEQTCQSTGQYACNSSRFCRSLPE